MLPLLRYRGSTVPVLTIDGKRVSSTMRIARALEALKPDPPIFPADEGAEAWADSVLQDGVRQLGRYGAAKDREAMVELRRPARCSASRSATCRKAMPVLRPVVALQMRISDDTAKACLAALPGQLDRVDALLGEGVIGGERPNAVDFQVAPSVRLMLNFDQLREHIDARPAGRHARALVPDYPGRVREVFPASWLPF